MIGKFWGGPADGLDCGSPRRLIHVVVEDGKPVLVNDATNGASQYWHRCLATNLWEWVPTYPREPFEEQFTPPQRPPGACGHPERS